MKNNLAKPLNVMKDQVLPRMRSGSWTPFDAACLGAGLRPPSAVPFFEGVREKGRVDWQPVAWHKESLFCFGSFQGSASGTLPRVLVPACLQSSSGCGEGDQLLRRVRCIIGWCFNKNE